MLAVGRNPSQNKQILSTAFHLLGQMFHVIEVLFFMLGLTKKLLTKLNLVTNETKNAQLSKQLV